VGQLYQKKSIKNALYYEHYTWPMHNCTSPENGNEKETVKAPRILENQSEYHVAIHVE
jgi:hypothetical protein